MTDAVPSILLPFAGNCEASRDADVALTFDAGEPLHIRSSYLLASTVLQVALEDFQRTGPIHLGADNRGIWLVLLHLIHPLGVPRVLKHLTNARLSDFAAILDVARKYSMTIPDGIVDTLLEGRIKVETEKFSASKVAGRTVLRKKILEENTILDLVVWCVDYGLEDSLEACKTYVTCCLAQGSIQTRLDWNTAGHGGHELAQTVHRLIEKGHVIAAAKFVADLLDRMRLTG